MPLRLGLLSDVIRYSLQGREGTSGAPGPCVLSTLSAILCEGSSFQFLPLAPGVESTLRWEGRGGDPANPPTHRVLQEASPDTQPSAQGQVHAPRCRRKSTTHVFPSTGRWSPAGAGPGCRAPRPRNAPANPRDDLCRQRRSQKEHTRPLPVPGHQAEPKHFWTLIRHPSHHQEHIPLAKKVFPTRPVVTRIVSEFHVFPET